MSDLCDMRAAFNALPQDQKDALNKYRSSPPDGQRSYAYSLNAALRDSSARRDAEPDVALLDQAIRSYVIKSPMTLYRAEIDGKRFSDLKLGQKFQQANYVSSSTYWNKLHTHLKVHEANAAVIIFSLRVLNGVQAAFLGSPEEEVLLGRNRKFKVVALGDGDITNYVQAAANPDIVSLREIVLEVS